MPDRTERPQLLTVIGIDPGVDTGWAEYDVLYGELVACCTTTFWFAYSLADSACDRETTLFRVEDPGQHRTYYARHQQSAKIAMNAGGNCREAELLIEGLRRLGFVVEAVKPEGQKWSNNLFQGITGYPSKVSQHARDGARLAFGVRNWPVLARELADTED